MDPYLLKVIELSSEIHASPDLNTLNRIYNRQSQYSHPQTYYDFGIAYLLKQDKAMAKKALIKGAAFGINFPCRVYDEVLIDAVGQCFAHLLTQFQPSGSSTTEKAFALAYLYLSRCIEMAPGHAHDSYKTRAVLFNTQKLELFINTFIIRYLGMGILREPFALADYYKAATIPGSPHRNLLAYAERLHFSLDDIAVGGKDADEYALAELASFGEHRHMVLFKNVEQQFKSGALNMTMDALNAVIV